MSRRVVMGTHGVMCDIRHARQRGGPLIGGEPRGFLPLKLVSRDLVVRGVGPWIS